MHGQNHIKIKTICRYLPGKVMKRTYKLSVCLVSGLRIEPWSSQMWRRLVACQEQFLVSLSRSNLLLWNHTIYIIPTMDNILSQLLIHSTPLPKYLTNMKYNSFPTPYRGELSYLAPLGSENISAPYFKQCFFRGGGYYPPDWVKHHASQSRDRNNKYFILYIEFCINNKI